MYLVFAEDLYHEKLVGDEPEPIEVVPWPLSKMDELLAQDDFTEARSIAALFMINDIFQNRTQ
jgi:ADP-ribose diphosphatase